MPVGLDAIVTRLLIILCDFKYFIDKAKSIIKTHVMSDRAHCFCVPIWFVVFFSFFFVFSPFLIEESESFTLESFSHNNHGTVLVGEKLCDKFPIVMSVFGKSTSFENMFEWQQGFLKFFKSVLSPNMDCNKIPDKEQQDSNQSRNSEIFVDIKKQGGDILVLLVGLASALYWMFYDLF